MTGPQTIKLAELDPRSLCGIRKCDERAVSLFAWPRRSPVPLCSEHRTEVLAAVSHMLEGQMDSFSPEQWLRWIREHGKAHLFGGSV